MIVELGKIFWDLFSGFMIPIRANGPTTGPFIVDAVSHPAMTTSYDDATGQLTVTGLAEEDWNDAWVDVHQDADDPATQETEAITCRLHFSTGHSLATSFIVGGFVPIPR